MTRNSNSGRVYDLEERTFLLAKNVSFYCKKLPKTISNREYVKQIIGASGSVGANYIEANEALSDKDFVYRVKICRKESKESVYWLRLIHETNPEEFKEGTKTLFMESKWTNKNILINRKWQVKVKQEWEIGIWILV